jgi:hypothetical protein
MFYYKFYTHYLKNIITLKNFQIGGRQQYIVQKN